jgi:hypothetical protein
MIPVIRNSMALSTERNTNMEEKKDEHHEGAESTTSNSETSSIATMHDEKDNAGTIQPARTPIESADNTDMVYLPYRTLTENADMGEYLHETATGLHSVQSRRSGRVERYELVTFKENDPENPKNWSKGYKWWCTMVVALTCFCVAFNSAVITADVIGVAETFNVSEEVALLPITLFVVGFGVGPLVFAPISEWVGRKVVYVSTLAVAVIFIIPCAVAPNIGTLLVCRLIDGIAFSAPMTLVGGTLADLWRNEERGVPMAAFSAAPFCGPVYHISFANIDRMLIASRLLGH